MDGGALLLLLLLPLPAAAVVWAEPVVSRERTSMTRCGHELSTRRAAAMTSSMTGDGCVARVQSATCVSVGSEAGDVPRKPESVEVYRCVTPRRKGSPKCTGAGRPTW